MNRKLLSFVLMIALISTLLIVPATSEGQMRSITPYAITSPAQARVLEIALQRIRG